MSGLPAIVAYAGIVGLILAVTVAGLCLVEFRYGVPPYCHHGVIARKCPDCRTKQRGDL